MNSSSSSSLPLFLFFLILFLVLFLFLFLIHFLSLKDILLKGLAVDVPLLASTLCNSCSVILDLSTEKKEEAHLDSEGTTHLPSIVFLVLVGAVRDNVGALLALLVSPR